MVDRIQRAVVKNFFSKMPTPYGHLFELRLSIPNWLREKLYDWEPFGFKREYSSWHDKLKKVVETKDDKNVFIVTFLHDF